MISNFKQIEELFKEIENQLKRKVHVFAIGGTVLLQQGMKPATKDIDIITETKKEFDTFQNTLKSIGFKTKLPTTEYKHMNINQIFIREDFRIDLFYKTVCKGFSISKDMIKRANIVLELKKLKVFFCSNEDIFLFKTMTQREGDLEDCISLAQRGIDWKVILTELKKQIHTSGNDIWITWVGERLDILEEKGLDIPIMKELDKLRDDYFKTYEKKLKK